MTIKLFGWKDRDTAATDFLQLAYHGPKSIRLTALEILQAIRSEKIIPELKTIALDPQWEYWDRVLALRALREIRGDIYLPELAPLVAWQDSDVYSDARSGKSYPHVFLVDVRSFVAAHPSNEHWFWDELNLLDSKNTIDYINENLLYFLSDEWMRKLIEYSIKLIETKPTLLNLNTVSMIYNRGNDKDREWLTERLDAIVELCLNTNWVNDYSKFDKLWFLPDKWPKLIEAINQKDSLLLNRLIQPKSERMKSLKLFE